jgi:hypothetical protein
MVTEFRRTVKFVCLVKPVSIKSTFGVRTPNTRTVIFQNILLFRERVSIN